MWPAHSVFCSGELKILRAMCAIERERARDSERARNRETQREPERNKEREREKCMLDAGRQIGQREAERVEGEMLHSSQRFFIPNVRTRITNGCMFRVHILPLCLCLPFLPLCRWPFWCSIHTLLASGTAKQPDNKKIAPCRYTTR